MATNSLNVSFSHTGAASAVRLRDALTQLASLASPPAPASNGYTGRAVSSLERDVRAAGRGWVTDSRFAPPISRHAVTVATYLKTVV